MTIPSQRACVTLYLTAGNTTLVGCACVPKVWLSTSWGEVEALAVFHRAAQPINVSR